MQPALTLSNSVNRQWMFMTCNEPFGYWQDRAPADRPRLFTTEYWIRQYGLSSQLIVIAKHTATRKIRSTLTPEAANIENMPRYGFYILSRFGQQ